MGQPQVQGRPSGTRDAGLGGGRKCSVTFQGRDGSVTRLSEAERAERAQVVEEGRLCRGGSPGRAQLHGGGRRGQSRSGPWVTPGFSGYVISGFSRRPREPLGGEVCAV